VTAEFDGAVGELPNLLKELLGSEPIPIAEKRRFPDEPGVYLISDAEGDLYVGRCKSIRKRMGNHGGKSPDNSTFAFRLACEAVGKQKGQRRKALMENEAFRAAFNDNVSKIRDMRARFVVIENDVLQYMFELYVHLACKTRHNSFATH